MTSEESQILKAYRDLTDDDLLQLTDEEFAEFETLESKAASDTKKSSQKADMDSAIVAARKAETPLWQQYGFPYGTEESIATGEDPSVLSGFKDVGSLLGRYLMTGGEDSFEGMATPSEDREGLVDKVVTSPATGWTTAVAPVAATLGAATSFPLLATGAIEGLSSIAAGSNLDDSYGGTDAALDVGASMLPAAGPFIKAGLKARGARQIGKQLGDAGASVSTDKAKDLYDQIGIFNKPEVIGGRLASGGADALTKDVLAGSAELLLPYKNYVLGAIESTVSKSGGRSLAAAESAMSRASTFFNRLELLRAKKMDPELYRRHVSDLVTEFSDVPEVVDAASDLMGKSTGIFNRTWLNRLKSDHPELTGYTDVMDEVVGQSPELPGGAWAEAISDIKTGGALKSGALDKYTPGPIATQYPIVSKGIRLLGKPSASKTIGETTAQGLRFLPQLQRELSSDEDN